MTALSDASKPLCWDCVHRMEDHVPNRCPISGCRCPGATRSVADLLEREHEARAEANYWRRETARVSRQRYRAHRGMLP